MAVIGVDIGSAYSKAVVLNDKKFSHYTLPSGGNYKAIAEKVISGALSTAGLHPEEVAIMIATGIGASWVSSAQKQATDISCYAKGVHHLFPDVRTIIDIGGQASRVVTVNSEGKAVNFIMSEKCATGSGRFLQIIARVLQIDLEDIGPLSLKSENPVDFTTGCAVFAESEAISRISQGASKEDILAGVHVSIAAKIAGMVRRIGLVEDCAIVGGGAKDQGLVKEIGKAINVQPKVPEEPQITSALGAALMAI